MDLTLYGKQWDWFWKERLPSKIEGSVIISIDVTD